MVLGRLIGTLIGFWVFNIFGAVLGYIAGHYFDKGLKGIDQKFSPEERLAVERAFFDAVFPLLGKLAKSDGQISEEEVRSTEQLMTKMGLSSEARVEAIERFKNGAGRDYNIDSDIANFLDKCGKLNNLKQILLVYLITIAYADGVLHEKEEELLQYVADKLGYSRFAFNHLLGMVKAQTHFYQGQQERAGYRSHGYQHARQDKNELKLAYQALGVDESVNDKELKQAYRRLMSEYHPDKLAGRGVPEDMVKLATERSQEIQSAYELVKKSRKA
ncbi:MAG: co-chaperone DjlA [Agarilytica sp.]